VFGIWQTKMLWDGVIAVTVVIHTLYSTPQARILKAHLLIVTCVEQQLTAIAAAQVGMTKTGACGLS
jgi:hypothetical protein